MTTAAQLQLEAATRLIKRRDKIVFEVQLALRMLEKYGTEEETRSRHLSVEDARRLEDGLERIRNLLEYVASRIEPNDNKTASRLLAYRNVLALYTSGFSDIANTRAMLNRISRDLGKVQTYTPPKLPRRRRDLAFPQPWLETPIELTPAAKSRSTLNNVGMNVQNSVDRHPESCCLGSEVLDSSKAGDQTQGLDIHFAKTSTTVESCVDGRQHVIRNAHKPVDLTLSDIAPTGPSIGSDASKDWKEEVVRFRALSSGNTDYFHEQSSRDKKGKGKATKNDMQSASSDMKERLMRQSTNESTTSRSVNFSRPLPGPPEPSFPSVVARRGREPIVEKRNAWGGDLLSPIWDEIVGKENQARAEEEALSRKAVKLFLTVLPAGTEEASYMQLSNVDIIEFVVVDAYHNPVKGYTWITSAPHQSLKENDAECITIVRNHTATRLKADPRSICLWFTTVHHDCTELDSANSTNPSKYQVNIFLDPFIRLVVGSVMHAVDYSKRKTTANVPMNRACVTVGELKKRARTQLSIHKDQRFSLSYQGVILDNDTAEIKEACSLTQRIIQGWDPLYVSVELETTRDCAICGDGLPVSKFSHKPLTSTCDHECNSCRKCVREWLKTSLQNNGPEKLHCTECPAVLQHADVRAHASSRQFEK